MFAVKYTARCLTINDRCQGYSNMVHSLMMHMETTQLFLIFYVL